jgi:hypothetical protein
MKCYYRALCRMVTLFAAGAGLVAGALHAAAARPNVLFILTEA